MPLAFESLKISLIIGIPFLFEPSQTPVSSNLKKEDVNGKKAERAEVVMFL